MPTIGGVTSTGYILKTTDEIKADLEADILANVDATLDLSPRQPLGQIIGIFAERIAQMYELGEQLYHQFDRNGAEAASLDNLGILTGTDRKGATKTKVTATVNLDASKTLPAGSLAAIAGHPEYQFVLVSDAVNTTTSAANVTSSWEAVNAGAVVCLAGTLTTIVTPVAGWNSITNALDGSVGREIETDTEYRARQEAELFMPGSTTADAIRAAVLNVAGVLECQVRQNDLDIWADPDGGSLLLPPHSFEVIVWDGVSPAASNASIAQAIWDNKPVGVTYYGGGDSGSATDSQGVVHTVAFWRAAPVLIYMKETISTGTGYVGATAVKAAIVDKSQARQKIGLDVTAVFYEAAPFGLDGVDDVSGFGIGLSASPSGTANIPISIRQMAVFDTSRITIS